MTTPGAVYLAASSHEATLHTMASRILASAPRKPLKIAASFAAAGGPMIDRMAHAIGHIFGGATVQRFAVDGESGATTPDEARAIVHAADLVFVSGGDPVLGARRLVHAGADAWLRDARAHGTPCLGISAGAIMLCAWWADWPDDPPPGAPHDGGELVPCTRVVPDLVVDCHAEEDHWNELLLVRGMLTTTATDRRHTTVADASSLRFLGLPSGRGVIVGGGPEGSVENVGGAPFRL